MAKNKELKDEKEFKTITSQPFKFPTFSNVDIVPAKAARNEKMINAMSTSNR
jgi:hypothetical protein